MPLTDFLSPAEIEARFRKRYGLRAEMGLWLGIGLVALGIIAYFRGLHGPTGPRVSADGKVAAPMLDGLHRQYPRLTLLPGLVDLSRPLLAQGGSSLLAPRWWRLARFNPEGRAKALREGVTAAVALGDPVEWSATLKEAILHGRLAGPRIAPTLVLCNPDRLWTWEEGSARAFGPQGSGNAIREGVAAGAEIFALDAFTSRRLSAYEISVATAAAHGFGRRVAVLTGSVAALADAAQAGADMAIGLPPDVLPDWILARLVERHVVVAPAIMASDEGVRPLVAANAYRLHAAGVPLALATAGRSAAAELEALWRTGIPRDHLARLAEAGAAASGLPAGGPVPGRPADLIGVDGEGKVRLVIAAGTRVKP